jgi:porin
VDANTEFAYVSNGTQFLNSSFGYSPAIVGLPTYPDPALSANIFWTFNEHFTLGGGVYDSNSTERSLIFSGRPSAFRPNSGGIFSILEADASWTLFQDNLPGRLGLGGYYHTGRFARFDGTTQTGAIGPYAVFDQTICAAAGIGIFAQFAQADAELSLIDEQAGAGFSWTGPLPVASRAADSLGLGLVDAHFSSHAGLVDDHELAIEGFYKIQVTRWFDLQPDLQYILNPGGDGKPDALVATVRVEIDF